MGPITFGAQIPSTEFSSLGSGVHDRVIWEDTGEGQEGKGTLPRNPNRTAREGTDATEWVR